jgi:hypothetical protein
MLEFLLGRRDATRDWQQASTHPLRFALDAAQLNSARLGGALEEASFLGPAEDRRAARHGVYCYYSRGVCLSCGQGETISTLELVFEDEEGKYRPYEGVITFRGAEASLGGISADDFQRQFGECYWRDAEDEETILFHEMPSREWQVEFNEQRKLKRLIVTSDPIMSDAEQRAAYGVTRPWPPSFAMG